MSLPHRASRLGLGTSMLRSARGGLTEDDAHHLLQTAIRNGITLFDTAGTYGQGDAERSLGAAFSATRDDIVVMTKVGLSVPAESRVLRLKPLIRSMTRFAPLDRAATSVRRRMGSTAVAAGELSEQLERSLGRLSMRSVDVLFLHNPTDLDPEAAEELSAAHERGLCGAIGVATGSFDVATEWMQRGAANVVEVPADPDSIPALRRLRASGDATIVGRGALAAGRAFDPGWLESRLDSLGENAPPIDPNRPLSYLRWLVDSGLVDHVLIGTTDRTHLEAAARAFDDGD